ncbi:MAG: MauE/DoxX family redox-associated membrane protein, partial [Actinomycetota bacterium]
GFYAAFAGFVALALARRAPVADCGCFGARQSPPTALHLVLNLAAAAVAAAVAAGGGGNLAAAMRGQPLAGVPFLLLAATATALAWAVLTVLAQAIAASRAPAGAGPGN